MPALKGAPAAMIALDSPAGFALLAWSLILLLGLTVIAIWPRRPPPGRRPRPRRRRPPGPRLPR